MNKNTASPFESLSNEHLALLLGFLQQLKSDYREHKTSIIQTIIDYKNIGDTPSLSGWYYLYELPVIFILSIYFRHIGLDKYLSAITDSKTPNLDLLELGNDDSLIDKLEYEDSTENRVVLSIFLYALMKNVTSIERYGLHMSELLEKGRNGDDRSFFNAVRIDNTVIHTPSFTERFELAQLSNDKKFHAGFRKALKGPALKKWNLYNDTRVVIKLFQEADQLDTKSINELYQIFCEDFALYPKTGTDPARSLHQFILRFRKTTST